MQLNENIRAYRKSLGLTQEKLAEAMGVTVGAVSKWESGLSNPDLYLVVELADFFEVSVDVLLGYRLKSHGETTAIETIKRLNLSKQFNEVVKEAQKALQKYPNSFGVVYQSATAYYNYAIEKGTRQLIDTARQLLLRSKELIAQSESVSIDTAEIENRLATLYAIDGKPEKAVELMKNNNIGGVNNIKIGSFLADTKKYDESLEYLSEGYIDCLLGLAGGLLFSSSSLFNLGRHSEATELYEWLATILDCFRNPEKVSYIDKYSAVVHGLGAALYFSDGKPEKAEECLKKAKVAADRFDEKPDYGTKSLRFYYGAERSLFDNVGESATAGIEKQLSGCDSPEETEGLLRIWRKICEVNE